MVCLKIDFRAELDQEFLFLDRAHQHEHVGLADTRKEFSSQFQARVSVRPPLFHARQFRGFDQALDAREVG
jgi:hypothetical protein